MSNARLITQPPTQVSSSTGTYIIQFETDELIKNVEFSTLDGVETNRTFTVLNDNVLHDEYPYKYSTYYNNPSNDLPYGNVRNQLWTLTIAFNDDTLIEIKGRYTQIANTNAASISNVQVYDHNNELLEQDIFNRWIIPSSYSAGSEFTITYDASYPVLPNKYPEANTSSLTKTNSFITDVSLLSKNIAKFTINDVLSTGTDCINLYYDDGSATGQAITYIPFTRDKALPANITLLPSEFLDITYAESEASANILLSNIEYSNLSIYYDAAWIRFAYINGNAIFIGIAANDTQEPRSAIITVEGTSNYGVYTSSTINIVQATRETPYIGGAAETVEYLGRVYPAIHASYKGNIINNTNKFVIYNVISSSGEDIFDGFKVYDTDENDITSKFNVKYISGTRNAEFNVISDMDYNYNTTQSYKRFTVKMDTTPYGIIEQDIILVSDASPEHILSPIWKDIYYSCKKNYFRFRHAKTDELLYNGVVYPNASNTIKINEILSDYISLNKYPFVAENNYIQNNMIVDVVLEISDEYSFRYYDEAAIYHLYWNYSYDYNQPNDLMNGYTIGYEGYHSGTDLANNFFNPIQYFDPRQLVFINFAQPIEYYNKTNMQVYGVSNQGNKEILSIDKETIIGDKFTAIVRPMGYSEIVFHIDELQGEDPDHDYTWYCGKSKCTNANYAVYYLNNSGLWCWMLFEGKQIENIKASTNKFLHDNSNDISYNIHNAVYSNKVEESYNLTSVYLRDEQSKMLKDLYTSPLIYIHELDNNVIYNVYLGTNTYDIKTYKNQGRNRYTHNIKLVKSISKNITI